MTVEVPIPSHLQQTIDATPTDGETYLITEYGKRFSTRGMGNKFRDWCDAAVLSQNCSMHGLRKAGSVAKAESGARAHEIMAVTGHRTLSEAQRYTEELSCRKLAIQQFERREPDRRKVRLSNVEDDSGTISDDVTLENNAFLKDVAARRAT